jgi:hypothetical protein
MTNGFYDTSKMKNAEIKKFIKEAIMLSYNIFCQTKYKNGSRRTINKDLSVSNMINDYMNYTKSKEFYVIDRFLYNSGALPKEICEYEIALTYGWNFLYIFVNEENFKLLIEKYKLKLKEW